MSGSGSRLVMSQPDATLYIQPPMFDTTVAVQISANSLLRKGAHTDAATVGGGAVGGSFAFGVFILSNAMQ
jgi:hypothetical protein